MADDAYVLKPGVVRSPLLRREDAPRQGSEGAPDAWIVVEPSYADALQGIRVGDRLVLVTWLHLGSGMSCRCIRETTSRGR